MVVGPFVRSIDGRLVPSYISKMNIGVHLYNDAISNDFWLNSWLCLACAADTMGPSAIESELRQNNTTFAAYDNKT